MGRPHLPVMAGKKGSQFSNCTLQSPHQIPLPFSPVSPTSNITVGEGINQGPALVGLFHAGRNLQLTLELPPLLCLGSESK